MTKKGRLKDLLITMGAYRTVRCLNDRLRNTGSLETFERGRRLYSKFVRPGDLCFDLGANIGRKSEALLGIGARVVALEPQPCCIRELNAFFGRNPRFQCVPKAVGSQVGTATLFLSDSSGLSSLKHDWIGGLDKSVNVEVTTLDRLIEEFGVPRFCKIDVEGFELEVFRGLSQPIPFLSFEYNSGHPDRPFECLDELERFGIRKLNMTREEKMELASEEWLDRPSFERYFREMRASNPHEWGGDIYVECEAGQS